MTIMRDAWIPPTDLDSECLALCLALNKLNGIDTVESCSGHGQQPFHVWFTTQQLSALPPLLYWFAGCHCGFYKWTVQARTDCAMSPVYFMIEGPAGAFDQADYIARLIEAYTAEQQ